MSFALRSSSGVAVAATFALLTAAACGGGGEPTDPGGNNPGGNNPGGGTQGGLLVSVSPTNVTLAPGGSATHTITITRTGAFTGAVSLVTVNVPTGVTATLAPTSVAAGATSATLQLTAAAGAPATTNAVMTITGSAPGISNASASLPIVVTQPPTQNAQFTITPSVSSYLSPANQLAWHIPTIAITRNAGYTGAISFTASGLPPLLVAGFSPANATGNTVSMPIFNAGQANGIYTLTIRAVGANNGGERTVTIPITVASPTTGSISWRVCNTAYRTPIYLMAVRDGNGAWTRIVPNDSGNVFSFNVASTNASVAWVHIDSGVPRTTVYNYTRQELVAAAQNDCTLWPNASTRTASGNVAGLQSGQLALVAMGGWATTTPVNGTFYSVQNLAPGPLDLVAASVSTDINLATTVHRMAIRRGINPASGATNAVLDLNGAESFAPTVAQWNVGGSNGEVFGSGVYFNTGGGTTSILQATPTYERTATTRAMYGVPTANLANGDLHQVILTTTPIARRTSRQVVVYARTLANRTISFGPVLATPAVTAVSNAVAGLLRAQGTLASEYNAGVTLDVKSTGAFPRFATVNATRGFLGAGSAYDVAIPDLTNVLGWDTGWNIRRGDLTEWWVTGGGPLLDVFDPRFVFYTTQRNWTGPSTAVTLPSDGLTLYAARAFGTIVP